MSSRSDRTGLRLEGPALQRVSGDELPSEGVVPGAVQVPPDGQPIAHMRVRETRALRVLTVGTDCNVGKMVASVELARAGQERGLDARFLATGQTGMMLSGGGLTLDVQLGAAVEQRTAAHANTTLSGGAAVRP